MLFRNFPYYRSPRFFDRSTLYTSAAVQINRENTPTTQKCAKENYFRFRSAILENDRGPRPGHRTVNFFEIDQELTKIWRDEMSSELEQSFSTTLEWRERPANLSAL